RSRRSKCFSPTTPPTLASREFEAGSKTCAKPHKSRPEPIAESIPSTFLISSSSCFQQTLPHLTAVGASPIVVRKAARSRSAPKLLVRPKGHLRGQYELSFKVIRNHARLGWAGAARNRASCGSRPPWAGPWQRHRVHTERTRGSVIIRGS